MVRSAVPASIRACARRAAAWAQRQAQKPHFGSDRCGLCAIASARLCAELARAGFQPRVRVVHSARLSGHCFVECDGWLLDITATQFGLSSVEAHPFHARPAKEFWAPGIACDSLAELQATLLRHRWARRQVPVVKPQ